MIAIKHRGSFKNIQKFLDEAPRMNVQAILDQCGQTGVDALRAATPYDTGTTANSWSYTVTMGRGKYSVAWENSNIVNGVSIAIILQYGHATGNGGYVQGRDYINPALQPVFDKLAEEVWREVTNL